MWISHGKGNSTLIYLDTHVVVWLYAGMVEKLSPNAKHLINEHDLYISPIVRLELEYLFEIGKITCHADSILTDLSERIELAVCPKEFNTVIVGALQCAWTRDPFDRIIVGQAAAVNRNQLLTKDRRILANYGKAVW